MSTIPTALANKARLLVRVFDGTRQLISGGVDLLVRILDGDQKQVHCDYHKQSSILFEDLPFYDNLRDNHTVIVSAKDYVQAGFRPAHISPNVLQTVDLMLLPRNGSFNFSQAEWEKLREARPAVFSLLANGTASEAEAKNRYYDLMDKRSASLACLFNITTAMADIDLPAGNPLQYLKQLVWDDTMQQDRFFAYADKALVDQVKLAGVQGEFEPEIGPAFFHPGATCSFKQVQFGEANVQLTFHENDRLVIDEVECVKVEPDIDYYKDLAAHALLEVIPSEITGGMTDPKMVYVLRWIAGRHAGVPQFNPPYTIVALS